MSYEVLARKWRPRSFSELVGQDHVCRALVNALDGDRLHHAYLFAGTRGVGKTTIARILAKSLNCDTRGVSSEPCGECTACREIDEGRCVDLIEVDAASRTRVDETRELLDNVPYAPTRARYKVYLIDEVHMFSAHSFNALLKTLEEPPPHVRFLLATTDPQKVPVTVLSRCLQFNLKLMPVAAISGHLERILAAEGVDHEPAALGQIARAAGGSMRDALSLLDQAIAFGDGAVRARDVEGMLGTLSRERLFALLEALAAGDAGALVREVDELASAAADLEPVLADLLSLLHQVAVAQTLPEAVDESVADAERIRAMAGRLPREDVQLYYQIATLGRRDLPWAPDPRTGLEMALLRMLAFRPAGDAEPGATAPGTPGAGSRADGGGVRAVAGSGDHGEGTHTAVSGEAGDRAGTTGEPGSDGEAPATGEDPVAADPVADWEATVRALELRGLAGELAANAAPIDWHEGRLRLALASNHAHLAAERYRQRLEEALGARLGRPVCLELVHDGAGAGPTPAELEQRRTDSRRAAAAQAIETDPVVRAFQERFGAQVERGSIEPRDGSERDYGNE